MALQWVVEWYQAYQRDEDMRALTEAQISRFESMGTAQESEYPITTLE